MLTASSDRVASSEKAKRKALRDAHSRKARHMAQLATSAFKVVLQHSLTYIRDNRDLVFFPLLIRIAGVNSQLHKIFVHPQWTKRAILVAKKRELRAFFGDFETVEGLDYHGTQYDPGEFDVDDVNDDAWHYYFSDDDVARHYDSSDDVYSHGDTDAWHRVDDTWYVEELSIGLSVRNINCLEIESHCMHLNYRERITVDNTIESKCCRSCDSKMFRDNPWRHPKYPGLVDPRQCQCIGVSGLKKAYKIMQKQIEDERLQEEDMIDTCVETDQDATYAEIEEDFFQKKGKAARHNRVDLW